MSLGSLKGGGGMFPLLALCRKKPWELYTCMLAMCSPCSVCHMYCIRVLPILRPSGWAWLGRSLWPHQRNKAVEGIRGGPLCWKGLGRTLCMIYKSLGQDTTSMYYSLTTIRNRVSPSLVSQVQGSYSLAPPELVPLALPQQTHNGA